MSAANTKFSFKRGATVDADADEALADAHTMVDDL